MATLRGRYVARGAFAVAEFVCMSVGMGLGVTPIVGPVALFLGLLDVAWVVGGLFVDLDQKAQVV